MLHLPLPLRWHMAETTHNEGTSQEHMFWLPDLLKIGAYRTDVLPGVHTGRATEGFLLEGLVTDPPPWPLFHVGVWGLNWLDRLRDSLTPPHVRVMQMSLEFIRPQARAVLPGLWTLYPV